MDSADEIDPIDSEELDSEELESEKRKKSEAIDITPGKKRSSTYSPRSKSRGASPSSSPRRDSILFSPRARFGSLKGPLVSSLEELSEEVIQEFDEEMVSSIFGVHFTPYHGDFHTSPKKKPYKNGSFRSRANSFDEEEAKRSQPTRKPSAKKKLFYDDSGEDNSKEDSEEEVPLTKGRKNFSTISLVGERFAYNTASAVDKAIGTKQKLSDMFSKLKKNRRNSVTSGFRTPGHSPEMERKSKRDRKRDPYHEIIKNSVYLGVQPQSSQKHPFLKLDGKHPNYVVNTKLLGEGGTEELICGLVCTIQEAYEMGGSWINNNSFNQPINHNIFLKNGIGNLWMLMKDEQGKLNYEMALYRLYDLMEAFLDNIPIYIHCKSGKGRSVMFVILLFSFGFLSWHFQSKFSERTQKGSLRGKSDKMGRLFEIVSTITEAECDMYPNYKTETENLMKTLMGCEKPSKKTLISLINICEQFIKSKRVVNLGEAKRKTSLTILELLVGRIYGKENKAHSSFKSHDCAFLDDLGQTAVYKDLCIYMAGSSNWNNKYCEAFQWFLNNLVKNKVGWFDELEAAMDKTYKEAGTCGYFANTDRERRNMFKRFRKEILALSEKHPMSNYSQPYLINKMPKGKSAPLLQRIREENGGSPKSELRKTRSDKVVVRMRGRGSIDTGEKVEEEEKIKNRMLRRKSNSFSGSSSPFPIVRKRRGSRASFRKQNSGGVDTSERRQSDEKIRIRDSIKDTRTGGANMDVSALLDASKKKSGQFSFQYSSVDDSKDESSSSEEKKM